MQTPLPLIVRSVFGIAKLEDVPSEELHILTAKYPYCAPLHLLYARRLRDAGDRRYAEAVSTAAIHFSNPHWLQHQLRAELSEGPWKGEPLTIVESLAALASADDDETPPPVADTTPDLEENLRTDQPAEPPMPEERVATEPIELPAVEEMIDGDALPSETSAEIDTIRHLETEAIVEADQDAVTIAAEEPASEGAFRSDTDSDEETSDRAMPLQQPSETTPTSSALIHVSMPGDEADHMTITPEAFADPLPKQASLSRQEEEQALNQLLEPLHVTDYFASQGIEVSHDLNLPLNKPPEKTFIGWLRTMKRMQAEKNAVLLDAGEEEAIRAEAESSNLDEDVLTEAMAEVYAQQRLTRKAIAIYEKLSLLDPDRSATFAARIDKLKGTLP